MSNKNNYYMNFYKPYVEHKTYFQSNTT